MSFHDIVHAVLEFIKEHEAWAPFIVFVLAFLESIVGLSLAIPSTPLFVGVGALIGASGLAFWPIFAGVALGGFIGDWVSYVLGFRLKDRVLGWEAVKSKPQLILRTQGFVQKWGAAGVFLGRFVSPIRSFVPFVAGMFLMPQLWFQLANAASAIVWAYVLLAPGAALIRNYLG
ncbi:cytochrome o ubiquinol oxidase [Methylopila jiangsuensis]|uniref:Cytochrome o ubiquinol oxidase n=1 Tax=Methylopila jiangsuensis TaxID=586230 RepID=A0A9W6JFI0_9HYPH|nr:DedA family protein [Methylopila jiangsuensis]MDR6286324.1 membrane protein DedA with SNARE-associated domain [Methylopila jiangsuensis]GLK76087.1 cytochrome o ubiquinol oxidase [Methylopila jiangsuensis]